MFATQKVRIKKLSQAEYDALRLLHHYAMNLYNVGHVNNQNSVQIPFWKFRRFLNHLCEKNGIVKEQT